MSWWDVLSAGASSQNISSTDALCEGPIYGLLNGEGSVYLNDNPALNAEFHAFAPFRTEQVGTQKSGTITFSGGTLGTVDNNTFLPTDITVSSTAPRTLYLLDEAAGQGKVTVTLSNVTDVGDYYSVTLTATNFTTYHVTDYDTNLSILVTNGKEIKGQFTRTNSTTGVFRYQKAGPILDADNFETDGILETIQKVGVTAVDAVAGTISIDQTLTGTYLFQLSMQNSFSAQEGGTGSSTFDPDAPINTVENLYVQENTGTLDQSPLREIGGVGAGVVIQGSTNSVNLPNLKMLDPNSASTYGVALFDVNGMPNTNGNDDYPGNPDFTDTNADPTILNTSDFGLTTSAKVAEADKVTFTIEYPSGLFNQNNENGDKSNCYAFYDMRIEFKIGTSTSWTNERPIFERGFQGTGLASAGKLVKHYGKKTSALAFQHVVDLGLYKEEFMYTDFRIKIFRVTRHIGLPIYSGGTRGRETNKNKFQVVCAAAVTTLQAVIQDNFSYPYTAVVSTTFSSKNFKRPPKRSYEILGKLVKIPDSYVPREQSPTGKAEYNDFWGGSFKEGLHYTDNPAWIFYDIITNNRYGAGKWIKEADVDKYALYRISKFCDELVDAYDPVSAEYLTRGEYYKITALGNTDWNYAANTTGVTYAVDDVIRVRRIPTGTGKVSRMEPRYRMNLFITKAQPVYKILKDMSSAFASILYWLDGKLTLVQDVPQEPVGLFSKANVIDGRFTYEGSSIKTRVNQVVVYWNDPTINYERVPLIVEDAADIVKQGKTISTDAVAHGCTSETQAIRFGKWKLWTAQNQKEIISFMTGLEGRFVQPGDVIAVHDADRKGFTHSGRISSVSGTTITVDRTLTFSGGTFELYITHAEPAAIYTGQNNVTINSVTYTTGDFIPEAFIYENGTLTLRDLDTESSATNALDSAGNPLPVEWKPYIHTKSYPVVSPTSGTNTITISGSFDRTPVAGAVWGLKELSGTLTVTGSSKLYRIIDVRKEKAHLVQISAVEHYNDKFVSIEEEYELGTVPDNVDSPEQEPDVIPPPTGLEVTATGPEKAPESELTLSWVAPDTSFVASYEIMTNIPD